VLWGEDEFASQALRVASPRMLRWGILGPGYIAGKALAPALRACGHDLAVVGSRSLTRAQAFAANHGVRRARGSYQEVVDASDVDAIYVALPNDLHEEWSIAALEAGKHVLCEKPLAMDGDSAGRMAAASARTSKLLMEAVMHRFHPRTAAVLEMIRSGGVGAVRLIHCSFGFPMREANSYRARPEHGGGALLDVGVYGVATARWIAGGEPETVRATQRRWATGIDGTVSAVLAFPAGAQATVVASFDVARHQALTVVGTEATLDVPRPFTAGADDAAMVVRDGETVGTWRADPYERMVVAFAEAAAGGSAPLASAEDSVATAVVLDWIRAAATG